MNLKKLLFSSTLLLCAFLAKSQTEDETPPTVNSLSITPNTVSNGDSITILINVTDDLSGITYIQVGVVNPNGGQYSSASGNPNDSYSWTDLGNGNYQQKTKITEWAISGEWTIDNISAEDAAGNYIYLSDSQLGDLANTFTVNSSTPDNNPPVINSLSILPDETINNGDSITVLINVTDDVSGLEYIQVGVVNPDGGQYHSASGNPNGSYSWTDLGNGNYQQKIGITEWAISGEWTIDNISAEDAASNYIYLNANQLGDLSTTFTVNSSTPDNTSPVINSLSILPNETINNGDSITILINVTDDVSGLEYIQVGVVNPNGGQYHSASGNPNGSYSWTNLGDGNYQQKIRITEWAISGEWTIDNISAEDISGNYVYLNSNQLGDLSTTFIVNGITGVNDDQNGHSISLYPNPTEGLLNIESIENITSISVYNSLGQKVLFSNETTNIDLSSLSNDLYLVLLETENGIVTKKVTFNNGGL